MNILLAYNSGAGSFDAGLIAELCEKLTSAGHNVLESDSHSAELNELATACDHICVVGGDGTLRDVIAAVASDNRETTFSQFPLGTINLVAREVDYKRNVAALVDKITNGNPAKNFHIAKIDGDLFLACASVGPDSWSVEKVSLKLKGQIGRFAYGAAFIGQMWNWKRQTLNIQADGTSFAAEAAYILKGRYFAGPWKLSETAALTNPKLSILLLNTARRRDFLRLILSVMINSKLGSKNWVRLECSDVRILSDTQAPVQADGDIVGHLPVHISVNNDTIKFI